MNDKDTQYLIKKLVKKLVKKELAKLNVPLKSQDLPILSNDVNSSIDPFLETLSFWKDESYHEEMTYNDASDNSSTPEDAELQRKLREMKFKQELRKDWILFLVKDVIVYSMTILFMFIVAGFCLKEVLSK